MTKIDRRYLWNGTTREVRAQREGDNLYIELDGHPAAFLIVPGASGAFVLQDGDRVLTGHAVARDGEVWVQIGGRTWVLETERPSRGRGNSVLPAPNRVVSPMIGTVRKIFVAGGDPVEAGAAILSVEAMKMEFTVTAPADGHVTELLCEVGQSVDMGQLLVEFEPATPADSAS